MSNRNQEDDEIHFDWLVTCGWSRRRRSFDQFYQITRIQPENFFFFVDYF
jgi:hypothetical protein